MREIGISMPRKFVVMYATVLGGKIIRVLYRILPHNIFHKDRYQFHLVLY
jgi:hypothetical protein